MSASGRLVVLQIDSKGAVASGSVAGTSGMEESLDCTGGRPIVLSSYSTITNAVNLFQEQGNCC